uniref:Bm14256 n=1 Tax=Brugia malayi TaxID=6279 RepID=A0A1I9G461_BRUMA|nr:Bm14256 [Brugia malayi]
MTDQLEIVKEIINLEDFNRGDNDDKASKQRQET